MDSLGYLSLDGMHNSLTGSATGYCDACFSGNYPIATSDSQIEASSIDIPIPAAVR